MNPSRRNRLIYTTVAVVGGMNVGIGTAHHNLFSVIIGSVMALWAVWVVGWGIPEAPPDKCQGCAGHLNDCPESSAAKHARESCQCCPDDAKD